MMILIHFIFSSLSRRLSCSPSTAPVNVWSDCAEEIKKGFFHFHFALSPAFIHSFMMKLSAEVASGCKGSGEARKKVDVTAYDLQQ